MANGSSMKAYGEIPQREGYAYACNMDEQTMNSSPNDLEGRLEKFFEEHAPHYASRVPMIIDAYREWPLLLFGDLDHNYGTHHSREVERQAWNNEDLERKRVRVQVAQDYIYRTMCESDYVHPKEISKLEAAKTGTSTVRSPEKKKARRRSRGAAAMKGSRGEAAKKTAISAKKRIAGTLSRIRKKIHVPRLKRKSKLAAPIVSVSNPTRVADGRP